MGDSAYVDGLKAYHDGAALDDNPFDENVEPAEYDEWEEGFVEARAEDNGDV